MVWQVKHSKVGAASLAYMAVVWSGALLGPTLLDLEISTSSNDVQIAGLVPATFIGYMVGGLLGTFNLIAALI